MVVVVAQSAGGYTPEQGAACACSVESWSMTERRSKTVSEVLGDDGGPTSNYYLLLVAAVRLAVRDAAYDPGRCKHPVARAAARRHKKTALEWLVLLGLVESSADLDRLARGRKFVGASDTGQPPTTSQLYRSGRRRRSGPSGA